MFAQVKDRLQAQESPATKSKTDIFSPRSPVYRSPLSSRRHNGNLPAGQPSVPNLILPQAAHLGGLQQQHLQHNKVSLYSPRSRPPAQAALQVQAPASALSPRQARHNSSKDHTSSSKDHSSTTPPSNLTNAAAHAASAAGRPVVPPLWLHQTSQQQSQLYSPRKYVKPAPLDGLSPRAALHQHHHHPVDHGSHAQPVSGSLTWRGPLSSPHSQQLKQQQSLQSSPSIMSVSRSAMHIHLPCCLPIKPLQSKVAVQYVAAVALALLRP